MEVFAQHIALEEHYRKHPKARPSLVQLAIAAARLDGDPLADQPELLQQAALEVAERWPEATGDDVLVYVPALDRRGVRREVDRSGSILGVATGGDDRQIVTDDDRAVL